MTLKKKLIIFAVSFTAFAAVAAVIMYAPFTRIVSDSGESVKVMDGLYFYHYSTVYNVFDALGAGGMRGYTAFHIADYFFLLSYGALMVSCMLFVVPQKCKWAIFLFPALPVILDMTENTVIEIAMHSFPSVTIETAKAISCLTSLKWGFGVVWFIAFVVFTLLFIINKRKRRIR